MLSRPPLPSLQILLAATLSLICFCPNLSVAQESESGGLSILDQLGSFGPSTGPRGNEVTLTGKYEMEEGKRTGRVVIQAEIMSGWHIYSLTQKPGGPQKSELSLVPSDQYQQTGPFAASRRPHIERYEFWPDLDVEEHHESLEWTAPIRIADGVDPAAIEMSATFKGQACQEGVCIPVPAKPIEVSFAGLYSPAASVVDPYRPKGAHVTFVGQATPAVVAPGSTVTLTWQATPDAGWHIYAYEKTDPKLLTKPTLISLQLPPEWRFSPVRGSVEPHREETGLEVQPWSLYHEQPVSWSMDVSIPQTAVPGEYLLNGAIGFQTCTSSQCDMPSAANIGVRIEVAAAPPADAQPVAFAFIPEGSYNDVAKMVVEMESFAADSGSESGAGEQSQSLNLDQLETQNGQQDLPLAMVMVMAFGGGFILNFMPCVLPVIGLKLMSFVQQSGESRGRVFALNLWYCAGLMAVFMVLASLAVFMGLGWGEQFTSSTFNIVLSGVVFVFALSFLGVWEIPLPGFVGSGKVSDLATQEGASGAFFKGVLTTVLATPCSGPMLGPALTWFVGQTPFVAYLGFGCVGLGMASPYLLIGAFPSLIAFLPKPGAWMDTFKQVMGFVLLGTVVFLLSYLEIPLVVPTVSLMMGLWAACWWVGRIPITANSLTKARGWMAATAFAIAIGLFSFTFLADVMASRFHRAVDRFLVELNNGQGQATSSRQQVEASDPNELPWEPFSLSRLTELTDEGYTVLVDFTADWCQTCKFNEKFALNQKETREVVDRDGIVTLVADKTHGNEDADTLLVKLGNEAREIPFYAIFPARSPNQPILLNGFHPSPGKIIEALESAGPSQRVIAKGDSGEDRERY